MYLDVLEIIVGSPQTCEWYNEAKESPICWDRRIEVCWLLQKQGGGGLPEQQWVHGRAGGVQEGRGHAGRGGAQVRRPPGEEVDVRDPAAEEGDGAGVEAVRGGEGVHRRGAGPRQALSRRVDPQAPGEALPHGTSSTSNQGSLHYRLSTDHLPWIILNVFF